MPHRNGGGLQILRLKSAVPRSGREERISSDNFIVLVSWRGFRLSVREIISSARVEDEVLPPEWAASSSIVLERLGEHKGSARLTFGFFFVLDGPSLSSTCQMFLAGPR